MTTAALYVRVSTRHQAEDGFSVDEHRKALTALASERGWSFRLYVDVGISGEKIDNRPGLLDLLTDAAHGQIDVAAVMDESRLARDELTAAIIRDKLKRAGITLVTPSGGTGPLRPLGELRHHRLGCCRRPGTGPPNREDLSGIAGGGSGWVLAGRSAAVGIPPRRRSGWVLPGGLSLVD